MVYAPITRACTARAPTTLPSGRPFLLIKGNVDSIPKGIVCARNTKGIKNQIYQTISGNHDEHPEHAPKNLSFSFFSACIRGFRRNKLKDTPEKNQKGYSEGQQNQRIKNKLIDLVEESGNTHPLLYLKDREPWVR